MIIYALDSNIISAILKNDIDTIVRYRQIKQGNEFVIPPIVFYEIRRGLLAKDMFKRLRNFEEFCRDIEIGKFNIQVWLKAAEIYATLSKQGKPIGTNFDGDVFIAAYCIINGYTLITNNKSHFGRIDGLKFENWNFI